MQTNDYHFNLKNIIFVGLFILTLCPSFTSAESFSCAKIFRSEYAMFLFKSPTFLMNELEMSMYYHKSELKGTLFFNMCFETTIENFCGEGTSVTGKFVFVTKTPLPGQPKCLVINSKDDQDWNYSMFKAKDEIVQLDGVRLENSALTVEAIGGLTEVVDDLVENAQEKILSGLDDLNLKNVVPNDLGNFVKNKIEIDSDSKNYRLLAGINDKENDENKQIELKQAILKKYMNSLNPKIDQIQEKEDINRSSNTLFPPQEKKEQMKIGDDLLEEQFVMKNFIKKNLNSQISSNFKNKNSENQKFRILTGKTENNNRNPNLLYPPEIQKKKYKLGDDVIEEGLAVQKRIKKQLEAEIASKFKINNDTNRTPNLLFPPEKKDNYKVGDDVIEEGLVMKNLIKKQLDANIASKFKNKNSENQKFRILSKKEDNMDNIVKDAMNKVKGVLIEDISSKMNFYCETENPKITSHYLPQQKLLEINVFSSDGCVVNFEFLQLLNEIPWITGSVFLILGIGLAFFGIKVYKNMLMVFIPMMITILGFYLYFAFVENKTTSTTKILTLVGLLVFIFIIAILLVWFNWLIYLIVAFGVSCQFGLLTQSLLEQNVEFFTKPYTEWILITIFFVLFTIMYIVAKDYFLILATTIMGSLFIMLSLKYLGITSYDLLFDTQIDKLGDFKNLDSEVQKMTIVFVAILIIGMVIQIVLLKKEQNSEKDEKNLQNIHDDGKNINIQLENI